MLVSGGLAWGCVYEGEAMIEAGFDRFVEGLCAHYASWATVAAAGRYFRMLLIGYFEGIDSERGLEWRCATASPARVLRLASASASDIRG